MHIFAVHKTVQNRPIQQQVKRHKNKQRPTHARQHQIALPLILLRFHNANPNKEIRPRRQVIILTVDNPNRPRLELQFTKQ